ncbi:MAG TPA: glycerol-3-phosphate dehydrogenase/oxidase [Candidatus Limnocylindrales bacterium]|nr:glycerol-3-phosphate dehydrogenase/oxidase [Candidatus Limnocylindrales bacterium]
MTALLDAFGRRHPAAGGLVPGLNPTERVASLDGATFDAVVIGAGILGAGTARELARRGLRTLVVDRRDVGWGTTNRSTRLVHGGLRYLEHFDFPLVHEGLRERAWLLRAAPHLVTPLGFLLPFYREPWWRRTELRLGLTLYDLLSPRQSLPRHRALSAARAARLEPALSPTGLRSAVLYWDGQVELPERLVVEILRAAEQFGATVVTHCRAVDLRLVDGRVDGVTLAADGGLAAVGVPDSGPAGLPGSSATAEVRAPLVVNASGPWADQVLATGGVRRPPLLRLTQGIHLRYPLRTRHAVAFEHPIDGRLCFSIPWQGGTMVGTTDTDVEGGPEQARVSAADLAYVDDGARFLFPDVARLRPTWAEVGVRSLMRKDGSAGAVSRKHVVLDHGQDGAGGLTTVAGGKLTAWRSIAADVVDRVVGRRDPTALGAVGFRGEPLPDRRRRGSADEASGVLPATSDERLDSLYGPYRGEVAAVAAEDPWWAEPILPGYPAIRAEIAQAVRNEWSATAADIVLRRLVLGFDQTVAREAGAAVAAVLRERLGWSEARLAADLDDLARELREHEVAMPV